MDSNNNILESRGCKLHKKGGKLEPVYTHSCCKCDSSDWLKNYEQPFKTGPNIVEVRFKNSRKEFFKNSDDNLLIIGDIVAVEASSGHDIGIICLTGKMVELKLKKKKINPTTYDFKKLYRRARPTDVEKWISGISQENKTMSESRKAAAKLELSMKINDVEMQGDGTKAYFYYTAEERVDFRELIKLMADKFQVRIEMRQIGARQEAHRLGGIGSCGRELCCSSWLTTFSSVSTNVARFQQLSLNPQRLTGQCSKLKCCLNYEADLYSEVLKEFPDTNIVLKTMKGEAYYLKIDVLKKIIWYTLKDNNTTQYFGISVDDVNKIIALNKKGEKPESLDNFSVNKEDKTIDPENKKQDELDISRFDKKKQNNNNNKHHKIRKPN